MVSFNREPLNLLAQLELFRCVKQGDPQAGSVEWFAEGIRRAALHGLVGMLEDDTVLSIIHAALSRNGADPETPIAKLLEAANEAGGHDNITAALVSFDND